MKRKSVIISIVSVLAVLLIAYIGGGMYYQSHFLPKTAIGSVDVSNQTVEEANRMVVQKLHSQTITVTENNQELTSFTPSDMEATLDEKEAIKQAHAEQGSWAWPIKMFSEKQIDSSNSNVTYNEEKLTSLFAALPIESEDRTPSQNAGIVNENGAFAIRKEVQGTMVDVEALKGKVIDSLTDGTGQVAMEDAYVQPAVTSEDEALKASLNKMDELSNTTITYTIAGNEEVVPKDKIVEWLKVNENGEPAVDQEAAKAYLESLHDQYATIDKTRSFESTNRGTVEIPAGTYGWSIATTTEAENLAAYILAGKDVDVQPAINGSGYHEDGTDIGSSYVEVDLQGQRMYMYKNGERVFESEIVAGHPKTPSPVGVFYAWDKVEDTVLVGYNPRRDADYETPVKYWIPINWEGIGIHDASWQGSFASDEYLVNGSNGCINTPPAVMDQFFSLMEVGMPVVIF